MIMQYEEAIDDFQGVIHLDESMRKECEWEIRECKKDIRNERDKNKKFASTFISNLNDPRSQTNLNGSSKNGIITTTT